MTSIPYQTIDTIDTYKGFYGVTPITQPSGAGPPEPERATMRR